MKKAAFNQALAPIAGSEEFCNVLRYFITPMPILTYTPVYPLIHLIDALIDEAIEAAKRPRSRPERKQVRRRPSLTLRPGRDTPLWNRLVRNIRPHLRRRGSKAQLARLLGLPRQRLQDALKAGTATLDAERTLMLVGWLGFFERGGRLVPVILPGPETTSKGRPGPGVIL